MGLGKIIPVVGTVMGISDGIKDLKNGDKVSAATNFAMAVPMIGLPVSLALGGLQLAGVPQKIDAKLKSAHIESGSVAQSKYPGSGKIEQTAKAAKDAGKSQLGIGNFMKDAYQKLGKGGNLTTAAIALGMLSLLGGLFGIQKGKQMQQGGPSVG